MKFERIEKQIWAGRYARIPGEESVFHLKQNADSYKTSILWRIGNERVTCPSADSPAERALADAVADAKRAMGGVGTGAFQINEFGQVLVPSSNLGGRRCLLVGEISQTWHFIDPRDNSVFDLSSVDGYRSGDLWQRPYIGMRYNLSYRNQIYFWNEGEEGGQKCLPERQDVKLIERILAVRGYGRVRFIVNPWGIVLTKKPVPGASQSDEETWEPVYVGRINPATWFEKEVQP